MKLRRSLLIPVLLASLGGCSGPSPVPAPSPSAPVPGSIPLATIEPSPTTASTAAPSPSTPGPSTAARPLGDLGPIVPSDFSTTVDNQWFPVVLGATWTLKGVKDRKRAEDVFRVLPGTEVVAGVTCVIVEDDLTLNGVPIERTTSYYAQHRDGSVWFFGEDVRQLNPKGQVSGLAGSWRAGLDGAVPGLTMPAQPKVGDKFSQKTAHARFEVLGVANPVKVPFGAFATTVLIEESDPEEPGIKARKYYAPTLGEVRDVSVGGPLEDMKLTTYSRS